MPQLAVRRDLSSSAPGQAQACEYADPRHPHPLPRGGAVGRSRVVNSQLTIELYRLVDGAWNFVDQHAPLADNRAQFAVRQIRHRILITGAPPQ